MTSGMTTVKQMRLNSILDEATSLLIEKPNASMNEIAEYAGIGIATLHRYVESREQLMIHLGFRAIEVVSETMKGIQLDEDHCENYIPELIEALIPLGDKIHFLAHDATVNYNQEIEKADTQLRAPMLHVIGLLQQKGYFRQDFDRKWILDVLLFTSIPNLAAGHERRYCQKIRVDPGSGYLLLWD